MRVRRVISFQPTFGLVSQDEIRELTQNYLTPLKASIIASSASFSRLTVPLTVVRCLASQLQMRTLQVRSPRRPALRAAFQPSYTLFSRLLQFVLLFCYSLAASRSQFCCSRRARRDNELESTLHPSVARTVIQDLRESSSRCLQVCVPSHTLAPVRCFTTPAVSRLAGRACQAVGTRPRATRVDRTRWASAVYQEWTQSQALTDKSMCS